MPAVTKVLEVGRMCSWHCKKA